MTTNIFDTALAEKPEKTKGTKRKFRKIDAISVFLLVQDVLRGDHLVSEDRFASRVAEHVRSHSNVPLSGKTTSGHVIREYYERWRTSIGGDIGVRLDPKRAFDSKQKKEIYERDQAKCRVCNKALTRGDGDEYDHFPAPHALGGRTVVENGRLVCREHNPRGPLGEDDLAEPATMKARPKPRSIRVRG